MTQKSYVTGAQRLLIQPRYSMSNLKVLDFDIESRPLSYLAEDYTTAEVTAIAACWIVRNKPRGMKVWLLTKKEDSGYDMLKAFYEMYEEADVVVGHYIRKHDLPVINGALIDFGLPTLSAKLASDTKLDLVNSKYMSMSQENLAAVLNVSK